MDKKKIRGKAKPIIINPTAKFSEVCADNQQQGDVGAYSLDVLGNRTGFCFRRGDIRGYRKIVGVPPANHGARVVSSDPRIVD